MGFLGRFLGRFLGAYLGDTEEVVEPTATPPGPTIDALNAGSINRRWVFALGGYENLLTDAPTAAALEAWADTPWDGAGALGGLFVNLEAGQDLNPKDPLPGGGRLTIQVAPDSTARTFSKETRRRRAGAETLLETTVDCDDTTFEVKSTSGFDAPGVAYVGTETVSYSGVASSPTRLTGVTRGLYHPFGRAADDRFGVPHTCDDDPNGIPLKPEVSSQPRKWIGRWAGLWMHLWDEQNQLLNVKEDARLVFAGRVTSLRSNSKGTTDLELEHVCTWLRKAVLGDRLWSARMKEGIYIQSGWQFLMKDSANALSPPPNEAAPLVATSAGPDSPYVIRPGRRQVGEVFSAINAWLAAALADTDIAGTYHLGLTGDPGEVRTLLTANLPGSSDAGVFFLTMPEPVWRFLGTFDNSQSVQLPGDGGHLYAAKRVSHSGFLPTDVDNEFTSLSSPLRHLNNTQNGLQTEAVIEIEDERGEFVDQQTTLPPNLASLLFPGDPGGVLVIDNQETCVASKIGDEMRLQLVDTTGTDFSSPEFSIAIDAEYRPIVIRQILLVSEKLRELVKKLLYSTGTTGYNGAYDQYPRPLAIGVPGGLLGAKFEASCDDLPGADLVTTLIIDKPKKLFDIIAGDLRLRWAFLRWKDECLQFSRWRTPVNGDVILSEDNKASPAGDQDEQRPDAVESDDWLMNLFKLNHNRDFLVTSGDNKDNYKSFTWVAGRVSMETYGEKVETINAANTYSQFQASGTGIEDLIPYFASVAPLFIDPVNILPRTIDPRYWESLAAGDTVYVSDNYAQDPDTGEHGISLRPAIVVSHHYNPGGPEHKGKARPMTGDVKLMLLDSLRTGPYVPTADVDFDADNGGYNAVDHELTLLEHAYSYAVEATDPSHFPVDTEVRIVERDPTDPANPLVWEKTVTVNAGAVIRLNAALGTGLEPAWDPTKRYRVIFKDFPDVAAAQQRYSYQADADDGEVSDLPAPYQWTVGTMHAPPSLYLLRPNAADDPVELPPDNSFGDGKGVDVGTVFALNRTLANLMDFKTAKNNPVFFPLPIEWDGTVTADWQLAAVMVLNLSPDNLTSQVTRKLFVAPKMKSIGGETASVRVTLARGMPHGTSWNSVNRGLTYAEATFSTDSTDYVDADVAELDIGAIKDQNGRAYLLVEILSNASVWGLSRLSEGPRPFPVF